MVKRSIEQNLRINNFDRNGIMKETPWSRIRDQNSVYEEFFEIVGKVSSTGSVPKETIAVSGTTWICVQNWHSRILLRNLLRSRVKNASGTRSLRGRSPCGRMSRLPCKDYFKGTWTNPFCKSGIFQNACSTSPRVVADWEKVLLCASPGWKQPGKRSKKWWHKCSGYVEAEWALL